jgi:NitT/TauT family transport system substrate-binding protein
MRFKRDLLHRSGKLPMPVKLGCLFFVWLILIAWLHHRLNFQLNDRQVVRMGYMPVITNLAAPILDHVSRHGAGIHFQAVKFTSFAEMAEALRNNSIQAAFIIAPLAVVLHQQKEDVKVVLIGNRHESTLVARKELNARRLEDLIDSTIAVPMRYSGHNLWLRRQIEKKGLERRIRVVEMNPPDMASALTSGALDAYFVGEPFAAQTVLSNDANVVAYVESEWPGFICNLVLVRGGWLENHTEAVQKMVEGAARSGLWAKRHPDEAARIASRYWNQTEALVYHALTEPKNRIIYDRYIPKAEELHFMADLMRRYGLTEQAEVTGLVEDRFARNASTAGIDGLNTILVQDAP